MKNKNIFHFIGEVFCIYAINLIIMTIFTRIFGDSAQEISSMFALGSKGIPIDMMVQYFVLAVVVVSLKALFFTDYVIKRMPTVMRTFLMLLSIIGAMTFFICAFGWFPVNMWQPWAMFLLCFGICFVVSTIVMTLKINLENKKMEKGLERLKKRWEEEE